MFDWIKKLFTRKPKKFIGYRVIYDPKGKKEDMGVFRVGSGEEALELAQGKKMLEFFRSGSSDAMVMNFEAEPAYETEK